MEQNLIRTSPRLGGVTSPEHDGEHKKMMAMEAAMKNCELTFDSMFESGNLDTVVQV